MNVQKGIRQLKHHWLWFAVPIIGALCLGAAMFYGGSNRYWGPLESDLTNQFYPWRVFIHRWFSRGVFPFWDPHIFSGYPTIESQQMLNLHPLYLLSLLLKPEIGITGFTAVNTLIACLGMAWGLRRWGRCSRMAAAFGAGLYVFGALFAVRVMAGHITVVTALAWWPIAALSVLRLCRLIPAPGLEPGVQRERAVLRATFQHFWNRKRLRRLMAISALVHAMVCLAGAPQYIVYLFYLDLAILVAVTRRFTWMASLVSLGIVWVLALVVSAPQWLPALWYLPYTGRALSSAGATGIDLSPMKNFLLELSMPWPFGDDIHYGHLHFKNVWETATYPGGVALVLSFALLIRTMAWRIKRLRRESLFPAPVTPLGVAAAVVLLLAGYMMIGGWLPGFSGFREPLKARALLAFGMAIGSAAVLDSGILRGRIWKVSLWLGVALAGLLIAHAAQYSGVEAFKTLVKSFGYPMDPLAHRDYQRFLAMPEDAAMRYIVAHEAAFLGILVVVLLLVVKPRGRTVAAGFLFLVALGDPLFHHARAWVARHPWERAGLPEPVSGFFKPRLEQTNGELLWRVVLHPQIINRTHHLDGFYEYYGYDPLMPAQGVTRMLVKGASNDETTDKEAQRRELLKRVGIRYDVSQWNPGPSDTAEQSPPHVIEVPEASLFDVTRRVVAGTPGQQRFGPDMDGIHYVLPPEQGGLANRFVEPTEEFQDYLVAQLSFDQSSTAAEELAPGETVEHVDTGRPDTYAIRVSLQQPALVVFKTTWLPGWRYTINGEEKGQALFANNWMPAAIVPEGSHIISFEYRPVALGWSLLLAGAGTVALLLLIPAYRRKRA